MDLGILIFDFIHLTDDYTVCEPATQVPDIFCGVIERESPCTFWNYSMGGR